MSKHRSDNCHISPQDGSRRKSPGESNGTPALPEHLDQAFHFHLSLLSMVTPKHLTSWNSFNWVPKSERSFRMLISLFLVNRTSSVLWGFTPKELVAHHFSTSRSAVCIKEASVSSQCLVSRIVKLSAYPIV